MYSFNFIKYLKIIYWLDIIVILLSKMYSLYFLIDLDRTMKEYKTPYLFYKSTIVGK